MSKKNLINNIKSKYDLYSLFSYVEFNRILKIIKYNKALQKRLNISINNYHFKYKYETKEIVKTGVDYDKLNFFSHAFSITNLIIIIYQITYSLIFLCNNPYNKFIIGKRNYSLIVGFNVFLCFFFILIILLVIIFFYMDLNPESKASWILTFINLTIYLFVFIMLLVILVINIKFENYEYTWPVICTIILILLYGIAILFIISFIIMFYCFLRASIIYEYYINDFNGFKIEDFKFDGDITKKSAKEIKLFFIRNANKFIFKNTNKQINLIELINQVRNNKYHIQPLNIKNNIPDIFINENSKIFFSVNNIVKINSRKYLFRNKEGEFEKKLHKNDLKIMRIIGMDHLNSIIIIEKNKIEYILIYDEKYNSNNESINSINLEVNNTERVIPYRTENNIISSSSEDF